MQSMANASIEEVLDNPKLYGLPNFEEFVANKSKWMGSQEDGIANIDAGDRNLQCKQEYYIEKYKIESLEKCERIAKEMGYSLFTDFEWNPQVCPTQDWKPVLKVQFKIKREKFNSLYEHRLKGRANG